MGNDPKSMGEKIWGVGWEGLGGVSEAVTGVLRGMTCGRDPTSTVSERFDLLNHVSGSPLSS